MKKRTCDYCKHNKDGDCGKVKAITDSHSATYIKVPDEKCKERK